MHMRYFGDSYDIVKLSLMSWLRRFGDWSVHPMLTEEAFPEEIKAFEHFLHAPVISSEVLTITSDRESYLSCATRCGNLFLDPDTGLKLQKTNGSRAPKYLFASELKQLISSRPQSLTLVFDQSLPRGGERSALEHKLKYLFVNGIHCFAYISHACFIVGGHDKELIDAGLTHVIAESRLPESRFLSATSA
jgi:hypothetical protein